MGLGVRDKGLRVRRSVSVRPKVRSHGFGRLRVRGKGLRVRLSAWVWPRVRPRVRSYG